MAPHRPFERFSPVSGRETYSGPARVEGDVARNGLNSGAGRLVGPRRIREDVISRARVK